MAKSSFARNKYGAKRVGNHASKKEHYRAQQLQMMQRAGLISGLREQVPFELIPAQYGDCGTDLKGGLRVGASNARANMSPTSSIHSTTPARPLWRTPKASAPRSISSSENLCCGCMEYASEKSDSGTTQPTKVTPQ